MRIGLFVASGSPHRTYVLGSLRHQLPDGTVPVPMTECVGGAMRECATLDAVIVHWPSWSLEADFLIGHAAFVHEIPVFVLTNDARYDKVASGLVHPFASLDALTETLRMHTETRPR